MYCVLLHVLPVLLQIRDELPHLKAIIQYIGNPPTGEGVYEVSQNSHNDTETACCSMNLI